MTRLKKFQPALGRSAEESARETLRMLELELEQQPPDVNNARAKKRRKRYEDMIGQARQVLDQAQAAPARLSTRSRFAWKNVFVLLGLALLTGVAVIGFAIVKRAFA